MSDDLNLPVADEEDFASDGIQEKDVTVSISGFERIVNDNGNRAIALTFTGSDLPFDITQREWTQHTSEVAQRIGRSNNKKVALAATGTTMLGASVIGAIVGARLYEDKQGFVRLKNFKKAVSQLSESVSDE